MAFISAIETVGDVSGITKGGAGREATDKEIQGATFADGLGTAIAGVFGGLPNTSFSSKCGLDLNDRRNEPSCCNNRGGVLDYCRLDPNGWCSYSHYPDQCSGWWCYHHVWHGCCCWRQYAVRC